MNKQPPKDTLNIGEPHPAAVDAMKFVGAHTIRELMELQEVFASCALTGESRLAEVCGGTVARLINGDMVSDRYLLGLAWALRDMKDADNQNEAEQEARNS
jgi:hypothetical protein